MHLAGRPVAAFDPEGLIFAAGINSESVKLYDLRSFDKGPFSSFKFSGRLNFFKSARLKVIKQIAIIFEPKLSSPSQKRHTIIYLTSILF